MESQPGALDQKILDRAVLRSLAALGQRQSQNLLARLVEIFDEQGPRLRDEIRLAWAARDFVRLREAAHALKGSARALGLPALTQACFELERQAATASPTFDLEAGLVSLDRELGQAFQALRQFLRHEVAHQAISTQD